MIISTIKLLAILSLFAMPCSSRADEIDDYLRTVLHKRLIPGLTIAVINHGKVVKAEGYGFTNLELQVPATVNTVYEIGSVSKQFTATVIMLFVEEGRIKLEDSIAQYLPALPPAWNRVTIRELLTHTSGIPDFEAVIGYESYRNVFSDETLLHTVAEKPMDFPPGEKWHYSNTGYFLLGMLIEKLAGKPYIQVVEERIFKPLGMLESRESDPAAIIPNRASGYALEGRTLQNRDPMQPSAGKGAGTLVSTISDLTIWDSLLSTERLLKRSSLEAMWTRGRLTNGDSTEYGFGWFIGSWQGHPTLFHSGGTAGFSCDYYRFVDDSLTIIVLTNQYAAATEKIAKTVAGFYVPALAPPVYHPIQDLEPAFTDLVKGLYVTRTDAPAQWDSLLFTQDYWASLKPRLNQSLAYFRALGPVISISLVERANEDENRLYRYRITYADVTRLMLVIRDKTGKISSLQGEEE
jgi:CubicO group peptidase (beta-lactamase class C family)